MKKLIKILLWTIAIIVGLVVVIFLSSPLWLGPIGKSIANKVAPEFTGTDFKIEKMYVNLYLGKFRMEGFRLANPKGYSAEDAVTLDKFSLEMELVPLFENKLHITNIDIIDPYISYVGNDGTNNFDAIVANVKNKLGIKEEDDDKKGDDKQKEKEKDKNGMKVVIDRLHIEGVKFKYGVMPAVPLLIPITLHDLGTKDDEGKKSNDGVSFSDMGKILADQLGDAFSKAGSGLSSIFGAGKDLIDNDATKAVGDAVKNVGEGASKAAEKATDAMKAVGGGAVDAAKSAGSSAADAAKTIGSGASDAAGKAADVATDAMKSVGDGAKNLIKGAGGLFGGGDKKEEKK